MTAADFKATLHSDNAVLIPLCEDDVCFIYQLLNSSGWIKYIGHRNINTLDDAKNYIHKVLSNGKLIYWIVFSNKQPVGLITLIKRDYLLNHDLGFAFLPQFQKMGLAYETASCVVSYLLAQHGIKKLSAICNVDNQASIRLLNKLNFIFVKKIIVECEELSEYEWESNENI